MLHSASATGYFPLTLTLSLRERCPRTLIAPCAHEPVFEHSFISNNLRVRFMGREEAPLSFSTTQRGVCSANVSNKRTCCRLFPLPAGEGQGEGNRAAVR